MGRISWPAIGCIVDGCPPNINLKEQDIQVELIRENLDNQNLQLKEKKMIKFKFLSGVFEGKTTGTPIS